MTAETRELVLLHNPSCSKSRAVKALLDERGLDYALRLYLDDPLDESELRALAAHPVLLERPILVRGARARVGRPPEAVLELL